MSRQDSSVAAARLAFVRRLGGGWRDLVIALELPGYELPRLTPGHEAHDIWSWLDERQLLHRLPEALRLIGRDDLADELGLAASDPASGRGRSVIVGSIPLRANHFQNRLVARQVEQAMRPGQTAVLSPVLTGLGGVGKTQIAADYARRCAKNDDVDVVVWVTASSREAVLSSYAEAADIVDGSRRDPVDRAAQRFLGWLAATSDRWLVVLDDLAQVSHLDGLWPPSRVLGRALVTTRRRDAALAGSGRRLVNIDGFTPGEARGYLNSSLAAHPGLADDVDGVAAELGFLPLALSHAAAFMIDRRLPCTSYRERFRDQRQRLPDLFPEQESLPDEYRSTIAVTWALSIEVADSLEPHGVARPLAELACVLDPNGTPAAVFATAAARAWIGSRASDSTGADPVEDLAINRARDGLFCLQRLNLVAVDEDNVVRMHALVQRAVRESLGNRSEALRHAAIAAVDEAWTADPSLGWQILSTLVKVAGTCADPVPLRGIFDRLLAMLDGRATEVLMNRAWEATWVIEDNFSLLLPYVLDALASGPAEVTPDAIGGSSTLGPPARITQAAASSLAASFRAMDDPAAADPGRAIPILDAALRRWNLRRRFVEALARYRDPRALAALLRFGRTELAAGREADAGILGGIAAAIAEIVRVIDATDRDDCAAVLAGIADHDGVTRKAARIARTAIAHLEGDTGAVPDVSDEEIIESLTPASYRGDYPDWVDAKDAAEHAYRRIAAGHRSDGLFEALLRTFAHPITALRPSVARCLGLIDDPRAREALLAELAKPDLPEDIRAGCRQAFAAQIHLTSGRIRTLRRWQALTAAAQAMEPIGSELTPLAERTTVSEPLVTPGAIEISSGGSQVEVVGGLSGPPDPELADLVEPADVAAVGPDLENKFRITAVSTKPARPGFSDTLRLAVTPTTWSAGASWHRAMARRMPLPFALTERALTNLLCETFDSPGIASVHVIVVTADNKVVQTQRPHDAVHSPGLWSVSFEEQVASGDFGRDVDPIRAAARRGLFEELHISADSASVAVHSAIVEVGILNRCVVASIRTPATSVDIAQACATAATPELREMYFVPAIADLLRAEAQRDDLHATSAIRLLTLADLLAATPAP